MTRGREPKDGQRVYKLCQFARTENNSRGSAEGKREDHLLSGLRLWLKDLLSKDTSRRRRRQMEFPTTGGERQKTP